MVQLSKGPSSLSAIKYKHTSDAYRSRVSSANQFRQCKYLSPLEVFIFFFFYIFSPFVLSLLDLSKSKSTLVFQLSLCIHRVGWPARSPRYLYICIHIQIYIYMENRKPELGELKIYRQLIEIYYYIILYRRDMYTLHGDKSPSRGKVFPPKTCY